MRYRGSLLIPPGTTKDNPAVAEMQLVAGVITEIEIIFPPGQAGLVHLAIYRAEHQLWPTSPDEDFCGDDTHITFDEYYTIAEEPYAIELRGWAPDATLPHTVYVEVTMQQPTQWLQIGSRFVPLPEGVV